MLFIVCIIIMFLGGVRELILCKMEENKDKKYKNYLENLTKKEDTPSIPS